MKSAIQFLRGFVTSTSLKKKVQSSKQGAKATKYLGRDSNSLSSGVVGLANVGKSTFFQGITRSTLGNPANYPFATIDAEKSRIVVESPELEHLAHLYQSQKKVPSTFTIYDIAGLTRNASSGEGLGNKFLSDIRQVDGIFHLIRGFKDDEVIHMEGSKVDPVRDAEIVTEELILKDLEYIESGLESLSKDMRKPHVDRRQISSEIELLNTIRDLLYESTKISSKQWSSSEIAIINKYNFLTAKPTVYLLNVSEDDYLSGKNEYIADLEKWVSKNSISEVVLMFSAKLEARLLEESRNGPVKNDGQVAESALQVIVQAMREQLHLISFYTCSSNEAHEWCLRQGSTVDEAAGVIHSDLQRTFISSLVYKYTDLVSMSPPIDESWLKANAKQHKCGKNYVVENGDVIFIKASNAHNR
ncbi:Piso0_001585 [Millerozyma farinosa CBS 7064]|uniref:Piso0_001585 protein n=1 Tax=Pichia sorbitophila (strain ATCC MYA-4447 / BCRC 22081 / CBS 7064 / NBRC 10061 / NRRL Y-12695) TaxID=559304 RepID=G8YNJ9_PICSO|nr:Piso0_001585 [Millerozyma farinosa CBS 7064]